MSIEIEGIMFYTTQEIAKKLGITIQTVRDYIKKGKLKGQRVGKSFLVSDQSLKAFLKVDVK